MFKKNKSAFTVVELMTVFMVMCILVVVVITTLLTDKGRKEKINKTTSYSLYSNFEKIYQDTLASSCSNKYKISNLEDINGDNSVNSEDLRDLIVDSFTLGEKASSCDNLAAPSGFSVPSGAACADLAPNAFVAVYLNKSCKYAVNANEAIGRETRTVSNTCGYIAYSLKNAEGVLGEDFFVYPLENYTKSKKTITASK